MAVICGIDENGTVFPIHTVKDNLTKRTSILTSRGHGKNTITVEYTVNQAATALITPNSGKKVDVCGVFTSSDSAAGEIRLDFATSLIKVWRHYITTFAQASDMDMHIEGAVDEVLTVTTSQGPKLVFIVVNYRELDA